MSETETEPYMEKSAERVLDELLKTVEEMEARERERYLPFSQIPDPKVRQVVLMLARKYADMTENFAQGVARRAENYGVMISTAHYEKPTSDGVILVIKFQVLGVRGDILKARYRALKQIVKSVKGYKSLAKEPVEGEKFEPGRGSSVSDRDTASDSKENPAEGSSEEIDGSGYSTHGYSQAVRGIIE